MSRRLSMDDIAQFPAHVQRQVGEQLRAQPSRKPVSPLTETAGAPNADKGRVRGVKRIVIDGIKFASSLEGKRWAHHKACVAAKLIARVHRQIIFDLPGPIMYLADFQIVENDGQVWYEDAKGYMTDLSRLKIKQVEAIYGVKVNLWPKGMR